MKTPDEIKKGLERCQLNKEFLFVDCSHCPYYMDTAHCDLVLHADTLAYIQQLEFSHEVDEDTINVLATKVKNLESKLAQAERERDAMHRDMKLYCMCKACKKFVDGEDCPVQAECTYGTEGLFEWRGVCEENTKEE